MSTENSKLQPLFEGNITINPRDPEIIEILGTNCVTSSQISRILRARGYNIRQKIEVEQGHVIAWMLALYRDHGMAWREKGGEQLNEMKRWIAAN